MPTINMNKRRLMKLIGKELSDEELGYYLAMIGTDVESIDDKEVIVEIFPNRPDMLSEEGVARALRYFIGIERKIKKPKPKYEGKIAYLHKDALEIRPYARIGIVRNVKIDEDALNSLIQLQEKIHITHGRKRRKVSIGVHDLSNISFPLHYKKVSSDYVFKPLGWEKEGSIKEILEKHEKGKEYGYLTDEKQGYVVWEDDKGNTIAFPPIINASITEVTPGTKDVLVDVTGTKEKEVEEVLNIVIWHLLELGGEVEQVKILQDNISIFSPNLDYKTIKVSKNYIKEVSGLDLNDKDVDNLLLKMGMYREKENVYYPPYRTDILHPLDIVEDVVIAYGYDKVKEEEHVEGTIGEESKEEIMRREVRKILIGMGGVEVINYHLTNRETLERAMIYENKVIETINPMNVEYNILRPSLFPILMKTLERNTRYEYPQFLFEIGTVFHLENTSKEEEHLAVVYSSKDANFSKIKGILIKIMEELGVDIEIREPNKEERERYGFLIEGRYSIITLNDEAIGWFGEVHPRVISNFNIEMPVAGIEINLDKIK